MFFKVIKFLSSPKSSPLKKKCSPKKCSPKKIRKPRKSSPPRKSPVTNNQKQKLNDYQKFFKKKMKENEIKKISPKKRMKEIAKLWKKV